MFTRWDKIIVLVVLFAALTSYCVFSFTVFGEKVEGFEVFADGRLFAEYKFAEIKDTFTQEIKTDYGCNVIEISSDGVRMLEASCPDKIDVQAGKISEPGQMIVCVPNKVMIRIIGKSKSNIDKVAY